MNLYQTATELYCQRMYTALMATKMPKQKNKCNFWTEMERQVLDWQTMVS
jgi:hypothetical protein